MRAAIIAVVGITLVLLAVIVGRNWRMEGGRGKPAPTANIPAVTTVAPAPADYRASVQTILAPIAVALAADDEAALVVQAADAKRALTALVVPGDARDAHLAVVLALARFEQDASAKNRDALRAAVAALLP